MLTFHSFTAISASAYSLERQIYILTKKNLSSSYGEVTGSRFGCDIYRNVSYAHYLYGQNCFSPFHCSHFLLVSPEIKKLTFGGLVENWMGRHFPKKKDSKTRLKRATDTYLKHFAWQLMMNSVILYIVLQQLPWSILREHDSKMLRTIWNQIKSFWFHYKQSYIYIFYLIHLQVKSKPVMLDSILLQ